MALAAMPSNNLSGDLLERALKDLVLERLSNNDCVALLGPRQVGKTTLALEIAEGYPGAIYLDLQSPEHLAQLGNGEEFFAANERALIVLDEIQCQPDLFPVLRSQIDHRRRNLGDQRGRFLILGSASLKLRQDAYESLTGRISPVFLSGFQLGELPRPDLTILGKVQAALQTVEGPVAATSIATTPVNDVVDRLWLKGGFPESYLADNDAASLQWRRDFLQTYIDHDIAALGLDLDGQALRRFWELLAARQGELWTRGQFALALKMPGALIDGCKTALENLLFVRELQPWSANIGKRLIKSPRLYIRDSGLHHALLNFGTLEEVLGNDIAGHSWEGFVIETLINAAPNAINTLFYRDQNGAEVDLVLEFSASRRWAIEIKMSKNPNISRGSVTAADSMEVERRIIVHKGPEQFKMANGFEAMPLFDACDAVASA